jgi:2-polyprenyl-6-hydroxyphenyl methylase/3-demethylubiquinone-9 3-methyltransferase
MASYYEEKLFAFNLKRCYDIAPPRIRQYLDAELAEVLSRVNPDSLVLEMGCGYGRIMPALAEKAGHVVGIDIAGGNLLLAAETLRHVENCSLAIMNGLRMGFRNGTFDVVACIQNGISAFHVHPQDLIREAVRVTRPGGITLFSSYSDKFWNHRLEWFELQAAKGLLGEIDYEHTKDGVLVCKDGFLAITIGPDLFQELTEDLNAYVRIFEVDRSSVFCEIIPL